jgi:hypothetical protein
VVDDGYSDEPWEEAEEASEQPPGRARWIRRIALVVAVAVAGVPLWNVVVGAGPRFADNGLEVCTFDYCRVEDLVDRAGLRMEMAALSEDRLGDHEAAAFVDQLTTVLGAGPVAVEVLDDLPGDIGGRYLPDERVIQVRRPATRWILIHEAAHTVGSGHGADFEEALIELAHWTAGRSFD